MSWMDGEVKVRIWLVDKLYPELSFEEFSDFAENMAERIYESNHKHLAHDASQHTREGRKPTDIKIMLDNGETVNIKELYFETCKSYGGIINAIYIPDDENGNKYKCYEDWRTSYGLGFARIIKAPDKVLLQMRGYIEELYGHDHEELKGRFKEAVKTEHGEWLAYSDWIDENPEWKFEKVVADDLPRMLIESEL